MKHMFKITLSKALFAGTIMADGQMGRRLQWRKLPAAATAAMH